MPLPLGEVPRRGGEGVFPSQSPPKAVPALPKGRAKRVVENADPYGRTKKLPCHCEEGQRPDVAIPSGFRKP